MSETRNVSKPCKNCPWMSWTEPGALGGSPPETYIGQAYGPFMLPCHKACDFDDPDWKTKTVDTPQCAGAAMFRRNMGISDYLPEIIHSLEPQGPVLDTPLKFYMHHKQITEQQALAELAEFPPEVLLQMQLGRPTNIHYSSTTKEILNP